MVRLLVLGGDQKFGVTKSKGMVIDQINLVSSLEIKKNNRGKVGLVMNNLYSSADYDAFLINGYFEHDVLCMLYAMEPEKVWFNTPFDVFGSVDSYKQLLYATKHKFSTSVEFSLEKGIKPVLNYRNIPGKTSQVVVFGNKSFILSDHGHILLPRLDKMCRYFVRSMGMGFGTVTLLWGNGYKEVFFKEFSPYIPISFVPVVHVITLLGAIEDKIRRVSL